MLDTIESKIYIMEDLDSYASEMKQSAMKFLGNYSSKKKHSLFLFSLNMEEVATPGAEILANSDLWNSVSQLKTKKVSTICLLTLLK